MSTQCPTSGKSVDEHVCRLNSFVMGTGFIVFIATPYKWIIFALICDYFIRSFLTPKISPVAILNSSLLSLFNIKPQKIDAKPKLFAAQMGFFCALATAWLHYAVSTQMAELFALMILLFAVLEVVAGFCMGCKIYSLLQYTKSVFIHSKPEPLQNSKFHA